MDTPLISLIIPYYKGEKYIEESLASVFAEGYENLEIIIVDDESPAGTLDVLKQYGDKIQIIHQKNTGQAGARNTGIRNAKGSLIAFLDQDDLWPKGRLAAMLPYVTGNTEYDCVRGRTDRIHTDGHVVTRTDDPEYKPVLIASALYTKDLIDKVGLFADMRTGEDFDWSVRLKEVGFREKRIPETTLTYRKHSSNQSGSVQFVKDGQFDSLRRKLQRARLMNKSNDAR